MKKLLSLLSVLTISGSAIPTTIAASPHQNQENNLETLNRNKRQNNNFIKYNKKLIIDNNDPKKYKSSLNEIINYLINENILISVFENNSSEIYALNSSYLNSNHYLIFPVSIIDNEAGGEIELVIRLNDFYIVGFINIIRYFSRKYY
ncbi:hypothetical protein [Spiroplasma endosymbiont of Ammophila pubescens]|uniref:hypothetical protein n=1 Tax=Spiroplasma endosymbiont of Ammophila pubescens TaxID=3066315 RepID=UPI0032B1B472